MTGLTTIRASTLPGVPDCPRRAAARTHRREIKAAGHDLRDTSVGIAATLGTAVHAGAARLMSEKATTGRAAPLDAAQDEAIQALREGIRAGSGWDDTTPNLNDAERQTARMVASINRVLVPRVNPVAVEARISAPVPGTALQLSGQSDLVSNEPGGVVHDLKTGQRRGHYRPQLGAYSLLERAQGRDVVAVVEDFVPRVPLRKAQPDPVSIQHDVAGAEAAAWAILRTMDQSLKVFREGDPANGILAGDPWAWVSNPQSMLCSARYCPAHGSSFCHEWQQR